MFDQRVDLILNILAVYMIQKGPFLCFYNLIWTRGELGEFEKNFLALSNKSV